MGGYLAGNGLMRPLFVDPRAEALFSEEAWLAHFARYEIALTRALAACGVVPEGLAGEAIAGIESFVPDAEAISAEALKDGLPVPAYMRQLKAHLGPELSAAVHLGATSQDLIDTAMVLSLREVFDMTEARLQAVQQAIAARIVSDGGRKLMARTRMQAALPVSAGDRMRVWHEAAGDVLEALPALRLRCGRLQYGGPVGTRVLPGGASGEEVARHMAHALGLALGEGVWHGRRAPMADAANWFSQVTGALGKIGQDLALMAQQGLDEAAFAQAGTSSAMAHKNNPVLAETLVTLARFNAAQLGGMHQALVHEQERSGAAWTLEWMILPSMAGTAAQAAALAERLFEQLQRVGSA